VKSSNRTRVILIGALLLALVAAALLLVRDTRPSDGGPPEVARARPRPDPEELSPAEALEDEDLTKRRVEGESPEPAPRQPSRAQDAAAFHGRVVDVATGEPVAFAHLVAGALEAPVDGEGRWRCAAPLPDHVDQIEFHNREHGTHIRTVRRDELEEDEGGWLARIAIGPTYRLHIVDTSLAPAEEWQARLVEIAESGRETRGSWIELFPPPAGGLPFLRYDNPWEPNAPGSAFRVDVRDSTATRRGASERLATAIGIYPGPVSVAVDSLLTTATGRVVDVTDEPIQRARVSMAPGGFAVFADGSTEEAERWPTEYTEADGNYEFRGLTPGVYRVLVRPRRGETPQSRTEDLPPGEIQLDDFVFDVQEGAGMIEGVLKSRRGSDFEHDEIVRLRAVDGREFEILDISSSGGRIQAPFRRSVRAQGNEGEHVFEFNEVPAGQYELSVVAQDGYKWTPRVAKAEPPDDELVFWREDDVPLRSYFLQVFDAKTGERIERFTVQHQIGTTWNAKAPELAFGDSIGPFPAKSNLRWTVHAEGYAPRWGSPRDAGSTGEVRIELRPGFGYKLILRDLGHGFDSDDPDGRLAAATRPPVEGAEIWLGDLFTGTSHADGTVPMTGALNRDEPITIKKPGWRVVGSRQFREGRIHGPARDVVVWMIRE